MFLIVETSQYLQPAEVAALSRSCKLLNSLCSMKLAGQPSLALSKRQIVDVGNVPDKKLARLLFSLQSVRLLQLGRVHMNTHVSGALKHALRANSHSLRDLNLQGCSDDSLQVIFSSCTNLRSLCLGRIGEMSVSVRVQTMEHLHSLTLSAELPDSFILQLLRASPNLTDIELSGSELGASALKLLPRLRKLVLLTSRHDVLFPLQHLAVLPELREFEFLGCVIVLPSQPLHLNTLERFTADAFDDASKWANVQLPAASFLKITHHAEPSVPAPPLLSIDAPNTTDFATDRTRTHSLLRCSTRWRRPLRTVRCCSPNCAPSVSTLARE